MPKFLVVLLIANCHKIMKTECVNADDDYEATKTENKDLAENLHSRIEKLLKENENLKTTVESKNREIDDLKMSSKVKAEVCNNLP